MGRAPGNDGARAGDRPGRRRPGVGGLRRRQAEGVAPRSASRASTTGCRPTRSRTRSSGCCASSTTTRACPGILLQLPTPPQIDGARADRADRPGEGRRRPDADLRRPARQGPPGAAPVHAARRDGAAAPPRRRARGRRGGRGRPLGPRRQAGRARCCWPRNATVTICHSRTRDLAEVCRRADVLVAAVGAPGLVQGDWVKEGAVVIDVGINRTDEGLTGDVDFEAAAERARLITPVPGGVGPMTIAMLLRNTLQAARAAGRGAGVDLRRLRAGEWLAGAGGVAADRLAVPAVVRGAGASRATRRSPSSTSCSCCSRCSRSRSPVLQADAGRSGAARRRRRPHGRVRALGVLLVAVPADRRARRGSRSGAAPGSARRRPWRSPPAAGCRSPTSTCAASRRTSSPSCAPPRRGEPGRLGSTGIAPTPTRPARCTGACGSCRRTSAPRSTPHRTGAGCARSACAPARGPTCSACSPTTRGAADVHGRARRARPAQRHGGDRAAAPGTIEVVTGDAARLDAYAGAVARRPRALRRARPHRLHRDLGQALMRVLP